MRGLLTAAVAIPLVMSAGHARNASPVETDDPWSSQRRLSTLAADVAQLRHDPDELYAHREDLASARHAAELWTPGSVNDFEAAWKLARVSYWLGTHNPQAQRRPALEQGVRAGTTAARLSPNRPEGHFWLAANMGELAESAGLWVGLRYRGRIRTELERVLAIDAGWQGGSADAALGQWFLDVPSLLGGSREKAEQHLRQALVYDPDNELALSVLARLVASDGRVAEARALLRRLLDAPLSGEWIPEQRDFKREAAERLAALDR